MAEIITLQEILSSGADVAIIIFAFLLWKMDRRLLAIEIQMKSVWKQFAKVENNDS